MNAIEARIRAVLSWMQATTPDYETKTNPVKDRSQRGKARIKARREARR